MQGTKILKVTGILMIIGGALLVLLGLIALAGGALVASANVSGATAVGGLLIVASAISLLGAALELIAGILGVKNCQNPEKAGTCFTLGIVLIALSVASNIFSIIVNGFSASMVGSLVLGLILPILYTYGASLVKKGA